MTEIKGRSDVYQLARLLVTQGTVWPEEGVGAVI